MEHLCKYHHRVRTSPAPFSHPYPGQCALQALRTQVSLDTPTLLSGGPMAKIPDPGVRELEYILNFGTKL